MVKVDIYPKRAWSQDKATYRLDSAIIAIAVGFLAGVFLALQGIVGNPPNYGLALSSILLTLIGLVAAFLRPKFDDLYRVAPRVPLQGKPYRAAMIAAFVYLAIGLLNKFVVQKELSTLSQDTTTQQIALLGASGINENLLIQYFLFSVLFSALLLVIGNYAFALSLGLGVSCSVAWVNHFFVYGLDPSFFFFVFGSFLGMGVLYWVYGSVMLTIVIHVWWNIGALTWQILNLPTFAIPGLGCIPFCAASIIPFNTLTPLLALTPIFFLLAKRRPAFLKGSLW